MVDSNGFGKKDIFFEYSFRWKNKCLVRKIFDFGQGFHVIFRFAFTFQINFTILEHSYHTPIKPSRNNTGNFVEFSAIWVTPIKLKSFSYPSALMRQIDISPITYGFKSTHVYGFIIVIPLVGYIYFRIVLDTICVSFAFDCASMFFIWWKSSWSNGRGFKRMRELVWGSLMRYAA